VQVSTLAEALGITELETEVLVEKIAVRLDDQQQGMRLQRAGEGLQLATRNDYAAAIEKALFPSPKQTLSRAALETLSIVAYRQPVTRMEIEAIRGVKCDYTLSVLLTRGMITEVGRKDAIGRPVLFGTTVEFLRHFGISSLDELPPEDTFMPKAEEAPEEE